MDHPEAGAEGPLDEIRRYWDVDAETYDRSPGHRPRHPAVLRAWSDLLASLLPAPPARVLDCGAGTGFLSLLAARAGHRVTALDLSPAMLGRLAECAAAEGLTVDTVVGPADAVPFGPFDVVMERHLLWTLPDPVATLRAWRGAAERLVVLESLWGDTAGRERLRALARRRLRQWRGTPPDHHGEYSDALRRSLPLGSGTSPEKVCQAVASAGWVGARVRRLGAVERAERRALPVPERLVGVTPRFAVTAG